MPLAARLTTLTALLLSLALLVGCENKVTKANYDKVETGMTLSRVEKLLGSGTEDAAAAGTSISGAGIATTDSSPEKVYTWKSDGAKVVIIFKDGKVVQKRQEGLDQ